MDAAMLVAKIRPSRPQQPASDRWNWYHMPVYNSRVPAVPPSRGDLRGVTDSGMALHRYPATPAYRSEQAISRLQGGRSPYLTSPGLRFHQAAHQHPAPSIQSLSPNLNLDFVEYQKHALAVREDRLPFALPSSVRLACQSIPPATAS